MPPTVIDLREFYHTPLGRFARHILRERAQKIWKKIDGDKIATLGYATPLLRPWRGQADRLLALMPRDQGAVYWPAEGPNITCFADLETLPLDDESMDKVIVMHALETAPNADTLMHEIWRILKNGGCGLLIVPNRRGFWAHHDDNPFGTGRPFSGTQLKKLVKEHGFTVLSCTRCLYMPPWRGRLALSLSDRIEKLGRLLWSKFGGVLILEIEKQVVAPLAIKTAYRAPLPLAPLSWTLPTGPASFLKRLYALKKEEKNRS